MEDAEMNKAIEFALNKWQTDQNWFRKELGNVTVPDVIRTCIQYGWNCKRIFDQNN